jgi:hypothetical protein
MKTLIFGILLSFLMLNHASYAASVKEANIDGIKIGMTCQNALAVIKTAGYTVNEKSTDCVGSIKDDSTSSSKAKMGTTLKFRKRGLPDLMLRHIGGKVYQVQKQTTYITSRLPEGVTKENLIQDANQKYSTMFGQVREETKVGGSLTLHFDDEAAPPYNRKIMSPHATISVFESRRGGQFVITIDMHWKQLVEADW